MNLFYFVYLLLSAFTTTGFDCHTSPVFSPANPESSIEDCLAHLGEKVSQELKEHLHKALQSLLSKWVFICFFKSVSFCTVTAAEMLKLRLHLVLHFFSIFLYLAGGFFVCLFCDVMCKYFFVVFALCSNVSSKIFLSFFYWISSSLCCWWKWQLPLPVSWMLGCSHINVFSLIARSGAESLFVVWPIMSGRVSLGGW